MTHFLLLSFMGFFVTLYAVSLGRGGGLLYVGVLTSVVGATPSVAIATSLAILFPTALVGSWSHWRHGNINFKLGSILFLSGAVGALFGSFFGHLIPTIFYRKFLGALLLWSVLKIAVSYFRKKPEITAPELKTKYPWNIPFYGLLGGVFSGITGTGGSTPVIAVLMTTECSPLEIIGTSVFAIAGISTAGFFMHLHEGLVNWQLTGEICLGALAGSFLAPILLRRLPRQPFDRLMKPVFAVLVAWMGCYMLFF